ncbi:MAG: MerR family transcriptional regulator [Oscillospiraceae bacterium]|nr:MerR family transcriptional regulator [Oscillospiraceae bacterium]
MGNTLSIYEFSKISGIEPSTLRYWDEIGLFSPIMRHPENNYRHYSAEQLPALNFVTTLCELDIPLKVIARLQKCRSPELMLDLLEAHEHNLDVQINKLRICYSALHARMELLRLGMSVDESQISVVKQPEKSMILWPQNNYEEEQTFLDPLAEHIKGSGERMVNLSFPVAGYHHKLNAFEQKPACPDHFLSLDPIGMHKKKAGNYLVGYARGYFGDIGDLPERMVRYAKENSITISGPVYTIYLHEQISTLNPSDYLAQCCITIAREKRSTDTPD